MSKLIKAKRFETHATISWIDKSEGAPKLKTEKWFYVGKFTQCKVETMLAAAGIIGGVDALEVVSTLYTMSDEEFFKNATPETKKDEE